jgi:soluble lytic murein transglycosylase-like protein
MRAQDRYDSLFQFYGETHGVDWLLLKKQMLAESGGNPDAVNPRSGARGLTQFMEATWREWQDGTPGVQEPPPRMRLDPHDPEDAIAAQAAYMTWLLTRHGGRWDTALAAYNWGTGHVKRLMPDDVYDPAKVPDETREYVARILG